jgi:hypothetical protein
VSLEPLFPGRNPKAGTDQELDERFERALSVREFARLHGWPLPQPERFGGTGSSWNLSSWGTLKGSPQRCEG